jgi:hypothetical protein
MSGKSTVLYTWLFSLAERYTPEQAVFVLVDLPRRFADYGGQHRLDDLPHVAAVCREVSELDALLPALTAEAETLAEYEPLREVFVMIDSFDESSEDIEENRALARDLAVLARRYGRDGCHFILAGALDGSTTQLRRRVISVRFGLGLRTSSSLDALRVTRTPAGFRGKELPEGRGYVVRSGQASLLQVASPYDGLGESPASEPDMEDEEAVARALDLWVERIRERYPDQKAALRAGASGTPADDTAGDGQAPSESTAKARQLLQRAMKWEAVRLTESPDQSPVIAPALAQVDAGRWGDEATLRPILTTIYREHQKSMGLPEETIEVLLGAMAQDPQSLEMEVMSFLPELDGDKESA